MALEIMTQNHRFMPPKKKAQMHRSSCGMYANYLHDLESILWIAIWTLLKYQKDTTNVSSDPTKDIRERIEMNDRLFSYKVDVKENRETCLYDSDFLLNEMKWIPDYFQPLKDLANSFKNYLFTAYCDTEEGNGEKGVIKPPPEGSVHLSILDAFKGCTMDGFGVTRINYDEIAQILRVLQLPPKRATSDEDIDTKITKKVK